ncbi:MAG: HAD family acid phosphatase [Opitutaceae bacterium]|nr:HAD family acid phosphatase [Opitutaceae bacterium]
MMPRLLRPVPALIVAGFLAVAPAPAVEPVNLSVHKQEIVAYISSGEYARAVARVALDANRYLTKRIPRGAKDKKMAVVFDIDETTLTNLRHIQANDFGYVPKIWDDWVEEGQAQAIIPMQTVYDTAVRGKVDIFFITGRTETQRTATERNLRQVGYETWTRIYYKPVSDPQLTSAGFKTEVRRQLTRDGYVIIANIGDQNSDLANGFAERTFKLPNPFYNVR